MRTNSEVFEDQTATLCHRLGEEYEFDSVDGDYLWPTAPGIASVFGTDQFYRSYVDESPASIIKAVRDLARYAAESENGPFDAAMGFSLGAALALTLLLHADMVGHTVPFKCAILLSATLPCDWAALEQGQVRPLSANESRSKVCILTVHFWSPGDSEYPGHSREVVEMCDPASRVEVVHHSCHRAAHQGQGAGATGLGNSYHDRQQVEDEI
ncbi:hypothetical protein BDW68DRAFT_172823 [Aspergillus falconensis]